MLDAHPSPLLGATAPATGPIVAPEISVVVVSFNTRDLLRECVTELERQAADISHETIVVDNASKDGSADMIAAEFLKRVRSDMVEQDWHRHFDEASLRWFRERGMRMSDLLIGYLDAVRRPGRSSPRHTLRAKPWNNGWSIAAS